MTVSIEGFSTLHDYIKCGGVKQLCSDDRKSAILELVEFLYESGKVSDLNLCFDRVMEREEIASTGVGDGVAIPHVKLDECFDFHIAIGIKRGRGIDWDSIDGMYVNIVVLICGPNDMTSKYLLLLSNLTSVLKEDCKRIQIVQAQTQEEVTKIFENC